MIRKSIVLSALILGFSAIAGSAQAGTISCPGERVFSLTTDPTSFCFRTGTGNINGHNDEINQLNGGDYWLTLDKTPDQDGDTGLYPDALTFTGGDGAGTFSFTSSLWGTFDRILVAFKSGEGGADPDWAAFELVPNVSSGSWTISRQGLSHINLYGHIDLTKGGDDPGSPVPEPASLFLFGSGVALVARKIRRRTA